MKKQDVLSRYKRRKAHRKNKDKSVPCTHMAAPRIQAGITQLWNIHTGHTWTATEEDELHTGKHQTHDHIHITSER